MIPDALSTHEVFNQTPPFANLNLAALDAPLHGAVTAFGAARDWQAVDKLGAALGSEEHLDAISRLGATPHHRMSFSPFNRLPGL